MADPYDRTGLDEFEIHSTKTLPSPARAGLLAWNPKLDLICVVTASDNVLLYRLNGQRVWGVAQKKEKGEADLVVEGLRWRPDGKSIALAYNDGGVRLCDVNHGKVTGRIVSDNADFHGISCVGWTGKGTSTTIDQPEDLTAATTSTPQSIFDLDVGQMLPKLSALPSASAPDSIFTSKVTLDALINSLSKVAEGVHGLDVLLVGDSNGDILLNLFETFTVGTLSLKYLCQGLDIPFRLLRHSAVGTQATHGALIKSGASVVFATIDLMFITQFGQYLHQLASASTKLRNILRYIKETVTSLQAEWKTMNDVPSRFVRMIMEEIEEKGGKDSGVELEFFELLVTGVPTPHLKEWLVDILGERNHKRWEKTALTGYENLRKLVHENLLPACERLAVLLTRLRGLARWKEQGLPLGLEAGELTRCLDAVSGLVVFCHEFLNELSNELELFTAFSNWLKYVLDDLSTVISIGEQKDDHQTDTMKVMQYLQTHLAKKALWDFFEHDILSESEEKTAVRELAEQMKGESIFELYKKPIKGSKRQVPGFRVLTSYLASLCDSVFKKPALAMKRNVRMDRPLIVSDVEPTIIDLHMVDVNGKLNAYIAFQNPGQQCFITIAKCVLEVEGGLSSISDLEVALLDVSLGNKNAAVVDLKFVDDVALIAILQFDETQSSMISFHYREAVEYDNNFPLKQSKGTAHSPSLNYGETSVDQYSSSLQPQPCKIIRHKIYDSEFVAEEVHVNGFDNRRIGCVLGNGRQRYEVFWIDGGSESPSEEAVMEVEQ